MFPTILNGFPYQLNPKWENVLFNHYTGNIMAQEKSGIELIAQERQEQIKKHNRTIEKDVVENDDYQLRIGAMRLVGDRGDYQAPEGWDKKLWKKMMNKSKKEKLIIAGALLAAEIDRLNAVGE